MDDFRSKLSSVLAAVLGFWLGAVLGNFGTYLVGTSGFTSWLLDFLPQGQPFVRLLFGILLAFLVVGSGGAITGVINGTVINRIDPGGKRREYLFGAGYAFGVAQGLLIIPFLLLLSLIGIYNNGTSAQPQGHILLFGLLGLIYGLVVGILLSTLTINFKHMWGVLLAIFCGYFLGGILLGLSLWGSGTYTPGPGSFWASLTLVIISLIVIIPVGIMTGLAYHRLAQKRQDIGDENLQPGRIQRGIVIGISLLLLLGVFLFTQDAESFLTVRPAATASQLPLESFGVHWSKEPVAAEFDQPSQLDISASSNDIVGIIWTQASDAGSDVLYVYKGDNADENSWSAPVNLTEGSSTITNNPQLVMDGEGQAHVVWDERDSDSGTSQVLYNRCQGYWQAAIAR